MSSHLVSFLKLFHDISEHDEQLITDAWQDRKYVEGDYLFKAGKVCREVFFICQGVIRVMIVNDDGDEVTYFFLKENQFCSLLNSFNNNLVAEENIIAACDVHVVAISKEALEKLYHEIPYLQSLFTQITQQGLLDKITLRNSFLGVDSTTRYKRFLIRQPDIALRVSMSSIASYLCITPQSLSRIRKNLK